MFEYIYVPACGAFDSFKDSTVQENQVMFIFKPFGMPSTDNR